ncbi:GNAT family N-acetyltransferase [Enterobacteriaceae bacterium 4M9]|nr:GNAT family N-acetyltransferase [Enterobacteriaceae bacterium 4M9]
MASVTDIMSLSATAVGEQSAALSALLRACVDDGASVGFLQPLSRQKAAAFWHNVASSIVREERRLLVALDEQGRLLGAVQLLLALPENQPHRGEVAKLLVHPAARRAGVARQLMTALEQAAWEAGRRVLVLDTASGSGAELFYQNTGWQPVGEVPEYALMPDGTPCGTRFYYKILTRS